MPPMSEAINSRLMKSASSNLSSGCWVLFLFLGWADVAELEVAMSSELKNGFDISAKVLTKSASPILG